MGRPESALAVSLEAATGLKGGRVDIEEKREAEEIRKLAIADHREGRRPFATDVPERRVVIEGKEYPVTVLPPVLEPSVPHIVRPNAKAMRSKDWRRQKLLQGRFRRV